MGVSIDLIKQLREMTGAGIKDCKAALEEANGDLEKAKKILLAKGLAKAAKKASRATKEGVIAIKSDDRKGVILELQCETDFVARNEKFNQLAEKILEIIWEKEPSSLEELLKLKYNEEMDVDTLIKQNISIIGENIVLKRFDIMKASREDSRLYSYVHFNKKIGVIAEFKLENPEKFNDEKVGEVIKNVVLQIAAMRPKYLSSDEVPEQYKREQIELFKAEAVKEGKPEHIAERIAEGRLKKSLQEIVLLEQAFFKDQNITIAKYLQQEGKNLGTGIEILRFIRYELGEE